MKQETLKENAQIQALCSRVNEQDALTLTILAGYLDSIERQLGQATQELQTLRTELSTLREEREQPIRMALQESIKEMQSKIDASRVVLSEIRQRLMDAVQDALESIKVNGRVALGSISSFLHLKPAIETLRQSLEEGMEADRKAISRIEQLAVEIHSASRHLKNIGRVMRGQEATPEISPNGKLAGLMQTPFRTELSCLSKAQKMADRALVTLEQLERTAPGQARDTLKEKPSVRGNMRRLRGRLKKEEVRNDETQRPAIGSS